LIVDDHPTFRATARQLLETEGFEVVGEAEDGASALESVERLKPEVVLLDVQLPDTDGFHVCAQLMGYGEGCPKVILTSSRDSSDFGPLVHTSGARGFVPKAELSGERMQELL
jgi:DNA-binding NarL/FixJ family response regulator